MPSNEYEAAVHLLEAVWYARPFLTRERIDWAGIDRYAAQIAPSEGEEALVNLAYLLWSGLERPGLADAITFLDAENWLRVIEALMMRRPVSRPPLVMQEGLGYPLTPLDFTEAEASVLLDGETQSEPPSVHQAATAMRPLSDDDDRTDLTPSEIVALRERVDRIATPLARLALEYLWVTYGGAGRV